MSEQSQPTKQNFSDGKGQQDEEIGNFETERQLKEKFDQIVIVEEPKLSIPLKEQTFQISSHNEAIGPDQISIRNKELKISTKNNEILLQKIQYLIQLQKTGQEIFTWSDPFSSYAFVIDNYNERYQYNDITLEAGRPCCFYVAWWWMMTMPWEGCTRYCLCRQACCRKLICLYFFFLWLILYVVPIINFFSLAANMAMFSYYLYGFKKAQNNRLLVSDEQFFSHKNIRKVNSIQKGKKNYINDFILVYIDANYQEVKLNLDTVDLKTLDINLESIHIKMLITQDYVSLYESFRRCWSWKVHLWHLCINIVFATLGVFILLSEDSDPSSQGS